MINLPNTALITQDEELSYEGLLALADTIVEAIPERSLVFLVASNSVPSIAGYVGLLRKHAVPIMVRDQSTEEQLAGLVESYVPQYWWAPCAFCETMKRAIGSSKVLFEDRGYCLLATGTSPAVLHPDLALLLTTSGSTGTPKFVRLSYENLESNARSIAEYQDITSADRAITTLPFSYSYGISIVNSHLLQGASIVLTEEGVLSRGFWNLLKETEATNFGGVPYTYSMLEKLRFGRMELPSLRFVSQAGGRLGERLQELFGTVCAEKGIRFFVMYGQTEATARMSWLPPERVLSKLGSIGVAIPGGAFELRDAEGHVIEIDNVSGELVYHGCNVSMGYAENREDLAKEDENAGILLTGDMAKRDEDGYYYIVGRKKRFLKMFGNRVNLDEMEDIFSRRGYEIACVGEDDRMVVFSTGEDTDGLRSQLASETKLYPKAFDVRYMSELPRTSSGKLDYASLEELC